MKLQLIFLDSFDSEFKGQVYNIARFIDPNTLKILSGTNLKGEFTPYKAYQCVIEFRNNKLKIVSAS